MGVVSEGGTWKAVYETRERAAEYEALLRLAGGKWHLDMLDAVGQSLELAPRPPRVVVELGVGTGKLARRLLRRFPEARLVGLDGSAAMLRRARAELAPFGPRVRLLRRDFGADGWSRGLPPADAVVSTIAIHHLSDAGKRRLYARALRALAPGGMLVHGDAVWHDERRLRDRDDEAWARAIQRRWRARHGTPRSVPELVSWIDGTRRAEGDKPASLESHLRWLADAGFSDVDCHWKTFGFAVFGGLRPAA